MIIVSVHQLIRTESRNGEFFVNFGKVMFTPPQPHPSDNSLSVPGVYLGSPQVGTPTKEKYKWKFWQNCMSEDRHPSYGESWVVLGETQSTVIVT